VKVNNQELKSLYQQYFAAIRDEERDSISKRVDDLIQQTNKNFTAISVSMRQLNDRNSKFDKLDPKTVGESGRNEKRVRTNVTTILARCFLENMIQFQDAQQQFKSMHTTRVKQLYLISNPSASQTDLDDLASMDLSVSEVFEQKFSATRHKAAQQALAYVKDKHKDILAIENGLRELQELFNQCAALVALQREFIDQIAANIDRTYESIKASNQELYQARYYQKHRFALSAPQYDRLYKN
jgi:syntaxin 1B/2/3